MIDFVAQRSPILFQRNIFWRYVHKIRSYFLENTTSLESQNCWQDGRNKCQTTNSQNSQLFTPRCEILINRLNLSVWHLSQKCKCQTMKEIRISLLFVPKTKLELSRVLYQESRAYNNNKTTSRSRWTSGKFKQSQKSKQNVEGVAKSPQIFKNK